MIVPRLLVALVVACLSGCQGTGGGTRVAQLEPGERPAPESDEAGLWMAAERSERAVSESGRVVTDAELNAYVEDIICRLASGHCQSIRIHVVRTPNFNASMSPNGYMQVWTGLVLRARNEDQLAFVIGHELAHFLARHSLQRWRAIRATSDGATFFQILTAAAGVPLAGRLGSYAAMAGLLAYSRDQERDADRDGLGMMARAGYEPAEAPRIWEALIAEREAEKEPERSVFFSTHPGAVERVATLRELAAQAGADRVAAPRADPARHRRIRTRFLDEWLADELRKREFAANLVLLDGLVGEHGNEGGLFRFYRGEVYRLRGEDGDAGRAASEYRAAMAAGGAPVRAYRSLGIVLWRAGDAPGARAAFDEYLRRAPDAEDRQIVTSYLNTLGG